MFLLQLLDNLLGIALPDTQRKTLCQISDQISAWAEQTDSASAAAQARRVGMHDSGWDAVFGLP